MADVCPNCGLPKELCVCNILDRETESKIKIFTRKAKFDKYGGDPDSRFGGGAPQPSPFSGFGGRTPSSRAGGGGSMWEEEISPEEMFNRFFGGGGGGFGPFGGKSIFLEYPEILERY